MGFESSALFASETPQDTGLAGEKDGQATGMQNPTYSFQKPLFRAAFEPNSNESKGDSYNPYPTSPHTHICSSDVLNRKLMWVLTLSLAALCPVLVVKASLEHGKGDL